MELYNASDTPAPSGASPASKFMFLYRGQIYRDLLAIDAPVWDGTLGWPHVAPYITALPLAPNKSVSPYHSRPEAVNTPENVQEIAAGPSLDPQVASANVPEYAEDLSFEPGIARLGCDGNDDNEHSNGYIDDEDEDESPSKLAGSIPPLYYGDHSAATLDGIYIQWNKPKVDKTFPRTADGKHLWVHRLRNAIANNVNVNEITTGVAFRKRWGDQATYYSPRAFEKVAWNIMHFAVSIHHLGWTVEIFDPALWKAIKTTESWTFKTRLTTIVELLSMSKRTCEDMMKGEKLYTVVGAPDMLMRRCKGNRRSNATRDARLRRVLAVNEALEENSAKGKSREELTDGEVAKGEVTEEEQEEEEEAEVIEITKTKAKSKKAEVEIEKRKEEAVETENSQSTDKKRNPEESEEDVTTGEMNAAAGSKKSTPASKRVRFD